MRGLPEDHAVAALHACATPISERVGTPLCWTQLQGQEFFLAAEYLLATPAIQLLTGPRRTPGYAGSPSPNLWDAGPGRLSRRTQPVDVTRT